MATLFDDASLVMIPSGYKDDKLYSIKPTDGSGDFTFSRDGSGASPATRVNSAGVIEKGRTNLLLQSNQFDTTWVKVNTTLTSGQSGYDGTNNAWLVNKSAASARIEQYISSSGVQTLSAYAKAGTLNWTRLNVDTDWAYYDLENGVVGTATGSNVIDHSIEDVGNGWYRCVLVVNRSITTARIYPADADNNSGGTSGNIYIQNAQLEKGLVATNYIATTTAAASAGILGDMPRLDYSGGATCPSLLLEPARTNLIDDYSGYTWDKFNGAAISFTGTQESPEGFNNAVTWTFGGTSGQVVQRSSISISNTTTYTISGYFKLTSGTLTSGSNQLKGLDGLSGGSVSLNTLTSEWQRLSFNVTSSSTSGRVQLRCDNSATIQVYGLQLEAGSYVTSIIPTYGSATARGGDVCNGAGDSSLFNDSEGVLFVELEALEEDSIYRFISISDGTSTNRVNILFNNDDTLRAFVSGVGSLTSSVSITQNNKAAIKYKSGDYAFWVNGTEVATSTSTSGTHTGLNEFAFDMGTGSNDFYGKVKQAIYFDSALTDAELAALTTL